jgi:uncharacterized membrane protein
MLGRRTLDYPPENITMIVLRLLHIFGGVFWGGAVFFAAAFLIPAIRASGPAGGPVMRQLVAVRRYPIYAMLSAIVTVLSGAAMYWRNISVSDGAFARSTMGMTYGLGAAAAVVAIIIGMTVMTPATAKLGKIGSAIQASGGTPTAEQSATMVQLQDRVLMAARATAAALGVAVIAMAVARYV